MARTRVYKICDANANCDQATVSVTVSHDAVQTPYKTAVTVNVLASNLAPAVVDHCERRISQQPSIVCATPQLRWIGQRNVACVRCFAANRLVL